jgi:hypothetical protein
MISFLRWLFTDRRTGRIVIGQKPNALVLAAALACVAQMVAPPGPVRRGLALVAGAASVLWGLDEAARGVNPWRRFLGAGVLAWQVRQAAE